MVSRKLVHRTNAWLIQVDFFYTYSWLNGLCFGYFQFFLSALRSIKNYVNRSLRMCPDFCPIRYKHTYSRSIKARCLLGDDGSITMHAYSSIMDGHSKHILLTYIGMIFVRYLCRLQHIGKFINYCIAVCLTFCMVLELLICSWLLV